MTEDGMCTIGFLHLITDDGIVATAQTGRKLKMHGGAVNLINLYGYNLLQLFDSTLHLYGLGGLISETLYEVFNISNLLLLVLIGTQLLFSTLCTQLHILVVPHFIIDDTSTGYFQCAVAYMIDESAVMTNEDHRLSLL